MCCRLRPKQQAFEPVALSDADNFTSGVISSVNSSGLIARGHPMFKTRTVLFIVLCASFDVSAEAQELLTWKFRSNEQVKYSVVQNVETTVPVGDNKVQHGISTAMDTSWKILNIAANGSMVMNQTFDRVRVKLQGGPSGPVEYDSASNAPAEHPLLATMQKAFGGIVNQAFQVTMTPAGQVENVQIPPLLLETVRKSAAGRPGAMTEDTLKGMIKGAAVVLPSQPVNVGSTWTSSQTLNVPHGTMTVNSKMTFVQKDEAGRIVIDIVPEIMMTPAANAPIKMSLESSAGRGRVLFDNDAGRVVQSQLKLEMLMKTEAGGQSSTQTVRQTTSVQLVP